MKPSFTVGIKPDGSAEVICTGTGQETLDAFKEATAKPDGKFVRILQYARPAYRRRRDLGRLDDAAMKQSIADKPRRGRPPKVA